MDEAKIAPLDLSASDHRPKFNSSDTGALPDDLRAILDFYLHEWGLAVDGRMIATRSARLLPVHRHGVPAMLKICLDDEERRGSVLMEWWDGAGAAPVLMRNGAALLLLRAAGEASLPEMARTERDDEACRILCATAGQLHASRPEPNPDLVPLERWFRDLGPAADRYGGILVHSAQAARTLLAAPRDICVLHGDLHHDNVLDFGGFGWLAIDPKGLMGERGFDFTMMFMNPDLIDPTPPIATDPEHFVRRVAIVSEVASLERARLLRWILAGAGLSAAWFLNDGDHADVCLRIAELADAELRR